MRPVGGSWTLTWLEHALPGDALAQRLALARRLGLALEVANRPGLDPRALRSARAPIVTLQAFGMHEAHPLHPDPERRRAGERHLVDTIERAAELGVPRVIAACGFGEAACAEPFESCRAFFERVAPRARERGVRVLIEPLSPRRSPAMDQPEDVERLLSALAAPDVFGTVLDTGHLLDGGHDPERILRGWPHRVDEVQLRGARSEPPPPGAPLGRWLACLREPPEVVCIEHRAPITVARVEELVAELRAL